MMRKLLAATAAFVSLTAVPALAAGPAAPPASEPVKLTDGQLDEVTAGEGLLDLFVPIDISLQDISVSLDINNVPVKPMIACSTSSETTGSKIIRTTNEVS